MDQTTQGVSPKLKLGAAFAGVATALLTIAAIIWPATLSPELLAAITGAIVTIAGVIGNYRGEPGNVVGFTSLDDAVGSPPFELHATHLDPGPAIDPPATPGDDPPATPGDEDVKSPG